MQTYMKRNENTYSRRNLYLNVSNSQEAGTIQMSSNLRMSDTMQESHAADSAHPEKEDSPDTRPTRESLGHARLGKQPVAADHAQTALWGDTFRQGSPE